MKKFTILFSLVLFSLTQPAYAGFIPEGITISKDGSGYKVNFNLPSYSLTPVYAEGEQYLKLEIPDYGITNEVGLPCLPQASFNLFISYDEQKPVVSNIMLSKETQMLSYKIYPTQAPWEKLKGLDERPFTINRDYYNSTGKANPPFVTISEPFILAGVKGVMVTVYPFAYNPAANELTLVRSGSFKINLQSSPSSNVKHSASFNNYLQSVFVNYDSPRLTPTNNYLIITAPEYESTMAAFVTHKQNMGYNVSMVNTNATGTTNAAILAYLQNLYNNMSTRPEFVLLVGDVDKIPGWVGIGTPDNPSTDLNYTMLEGNDPYADVFLGRFSVASTAQLTNVINKSIYMELNINGLTKKNVFCASNDNYTVSEGTHNFVIDSFFGPGGYTNLKLYCHTYSANTQQLIDALNANQVFAIYSGHGDVTLWADGPPLNQSQVNALTNTWYPYVYSFSCLTGQFQAGECFAETWIRTAHGGSLYWGSSVTSYWDEDDILEKRLYRAMFTDHLIKSSPMFCQAKIYLVQYYGSITPTMRRYIEMYNCFGDPSMYEAVYGPVIAHNCLPNTENMNGPYIVNSTITPAGSAIDPSRTRVFWTRGVTFNDSVLMTNTSGNNWSANIPGNGNPATYRYYIKTADMLNRVVTAPGGAPANYYSFHAMPDVENPVIVHTALGNCPRTSWPATVTANVTDNIGIDSVWVTWYKNSPSTGLKHFRLVNTSGSTFSAAFNSDTSQVAYNDSVFYRVVAKDCSSNHNMDSTSLNMFRIVAIANACVGTGTTAVGYPYYTYYMDSRTLMLYTASEILTGGGSAGMITRIGFNVTTAASQQMNGFNIKMQTTTASSVTGFINIGWATVYSGTYTVPGTGWQYIELQTPFYWDGQQNLLIEICYDNTSWTSNSSVNSTAASGMTWHNHLDNSTGCSLTGGSAQATRPNICMQMNMVVGNKTASSEIPTVFSLAQNYPNPFNPVTAIKYTVPKQNLVKLVIYDIIGREVATLVNEVKQPGNYSVSFDASNFASGVYFYRMVAGDFTDVKKMVLIK
jgi:hypothetical protein